VTFDGADFMVQLFRFFIILRSRTVRRWNGWLVEKRSATLLDWIVCAL